MGLDAIPLKEGSEDGPTGSTSRPVPLLVWREAWSHPIRGGLGQRSHVRSPTLAGTQYPIPLMFVGLPQSSRHGALSAGTAARADGAARQIWGRNETPLNPTYGLQSRVADWPQHKGRAVTKRNQWKSLHPRPPSRTSSQLLSASGFAGRPSTLGSRGVDSQRPSRSAGAVAG